MTTTTPKAIGDELDAALREEILEPKKRTVSTKKLERELAAARDEIRGLEEELEAKKKRRDRLVIRLRRHPEHPSARAIAELAGISAVWVLELAKDPE